MHDGLQSTSAKAAELLTAPLSLPLSLSHRWTGAPLKPCSSGPSPNYGILGGLLFIAVKALTPYCAVVSGWIQHRALLCRPQLFYAWVGWLGAQVQGTFFRFVWMAWLFLSAVCLCVFSSHFFLSVCWLHVCCPNNNYRPPLLTLNFCCMFKPARWPSLLMCILGCTYHSCFGHQMKPQYITWVFKCTTDLFTNRPFICWFRWFPSS